MRFLRILGAVYEANGANRDFSGVGTKNLTLCIMQRARREELPGGGTGKMKRAEYDQPAHLDSSACWSAEALEE